MKELTQEEREELQSLLSVYDQVGIKHIERMLSAYAALEKSRDEWKARAIDMDLHLFMLRC